MNETGLDCKARNMPDRLRAILLQPLLKLCLLLSVSSLAIASCNASQGVPSMNTENKNLDYAQRKSIVDDIAQQLVSAPNEGFKSLHEFDKHESQDLKRDLLAMAWRVALKTDDLTLRQQLVNYLLESAMKGTPFLQGRALTFLQDFSQQDFDRQAVHVLQTMPLSGDYESERIRLLGAANLQSRAPELHAIANAEWRESSSDRLYASRQWAAALVLARFGDIDNTERIIEQVRAEPDIILRATKLFADLAYTRQPLAFDTLRDYLHSQERLPQIKDSVPGTLEALYAAAQFAKHVEGCPVIDADVYEKDLPAIRQWADAQTAWEFRD